MLTQQLFSLGREEIFSSITHFTEQAFHLYRRIMFPVDVKTDLFKSYAVVAQRTKYAGRDIK